MNQMRVGLIVNPIAGMGGRVGLKGTDGEATLRRARELGAEPVSPERAERTLERLADSSDRVELLTGPGPMGEREAESAGFDPTVVGSVDGEETSAADTKAVARKLLNRGVDLLLFAGGDGTARDIFDTVETEVPVLGIPTGVKVYSGVFASSPRAAAELVALFLEGETDGTEQREVMDIDEEDYRQNRLSARLYGYLRVPYKADIVQNPKSGGGSTDEGKRREIARRIVGEMDPERSYLIGPGTTTTAIMDELGLESSLLGVDVVRDGALVGTDLSESEILDAIRGEEATIVVGVIGGQGCLFGRGNQQISPAVIRAVGVDNVVVVATTDKLLSLDDRSLFVDTNDAELDATLEGYVTVTTGANEQLVVRVEKL